MEIKSDKYLLAAAIIGILILASQTIFGLSCYYEFIDGCSPEYPIYYNGHGGRNENGGNSFGTDYGS